MTFSKWPQKTKTKNKQKTIPNPIRTKHASCNHMQRLLMMHVILRAGRENKHVKWTFGSSGFSAERGVLFPALWYPISRLHARTSATKQLWTLLQFASTQGFFLLQSLPSYHKPSLFWEFIAFTSSTREWKDKHDITKLQLYDVYHNENKLLLLLGYINNSVWAKIKNKHTSNWDKLD